MHRDVGAARRAGDSAAETAARARVQDAKVALGERGEPWWAPASETGRRARVAATVLTLLRARRPESSICPSDAARAAGATMWRRLVPVARDVADELALLPHPPGVVLTSSYAGGGLGPRLESTPVLGFVQKDELTVARLAELFG